MRCYQYWLLAISPLSKAQNSPAPKCTSLTRVCLMWIYNLLLVPVNPLIIYSHFGNQPKHSFLLSFITHTVKHPLVTTLYPNPLFSYRYLLANRFFFHLVALVFPSNLSGNSMRLSITVQKLCKKNHVWVIMCSISKTVGDIPKITATPVDPGLSSQASSQRGHMTHFSPVVQEAWP